MSQEYKIELQEVKKTIRNCGRCTHGNTEATTTTAAAAAAAEAEAATAVTTITRIIISNWKIKTL
mgnify:FL=1